MCFPNAKLLSANSCVYTDDCLIPREEFPNGRNIGRRPGEFCLSASRVEGATQRVCACRNVGELGATHSDETVDARACPFWTSKIIRFWNGMVSRNATAV